MFFIDGWIYSHTYTHTHSCSLLFFCMCRRQQIILRSRGADRVRGYPGRRQEGGLRIYGWLREVELELNPQIIGTVKPVLRSRPPFLAASSLPILASPASQLQQIKNYELNILFIYLMLMVSFNHFPFPPSTF